MSTAVRTRAFSFVSSLFFYIFHRHRVCLVDCVDLTCTLYSWWEGFGSSSLATLPLGFNFGFISTSACGSSTGVCSWGCPAGLGSAPVSVRWGGGAAAWVTGALAAPGTQANWRLGKQEIQCSRRVWQLIPGLLLGEPLDRSLAGHSPQGHKEFGYDRSDPACIDTILFFFFLPVAALLQGGLSMRVAQLLGSWGPWRR